MSKRLLIFITIISILGLAGCSSSKKDTPASTAKEDIAEEPKAEPEEPIVEEPKTESSESQTPMSPKVEPADEVEVVIQTTPLFEDVYVKQCDNVGSLIFQGAKQFAGTLSYNVEITEPSDNDLSTIKFSDENNNSVYLMFYADSDPEIETLSVISYTSGDTGNSISTTDDLHLKSSYMSTQSAGSSSVEVSSIEEQKEFMFSQE